MDGVESAEGTSDIRDINLTTSWPEGKPVAVLGRTAVGDIKPDIAIQTGDDTSISRRHMEVWAAGDNSLFIKPLGKNGFVGVNGVNKELDVATQIKPGDIIKLARNDDFVYKLTQNEKREWILEHQPKPEGLTDGELWKETVEMVNSRASNSYRLENFSLPRLLTNSEHISFVGLSRSDWQGLEEFIQELNKQFKGRYEFDTKVNGDKIGIKAKKL